MEDKKVQPESRLQDNGHGVLVRTWDSKEFKRAVRRLRYALSPPLDYPRHGMQLDPTRRLGTRNFVYQSEDGSEHTYKVEELYDSKFDVGEDREDQRDLRAQYMEAAYAYDDKLGTQRENDAKNARSTFEEHKRWVDHKIEKEDYEKLLIRLKTWGKYKTPEDVRNERLKDARRQDYDRKEKERLEKYPPVQAAQDPYWELSDLPPLPPFLTTHGYFQYGSKAEESETESETDKTKRNYADVPPIVVPSSKKREEDDTSLCVHSKRSRIEGILSQY